MNKKDVYSLIKSVYNSSKSYAINNKNKVITFITRRGCTKTDIKKFISEIFDTKVLKVNVIKNIDCTKKFMVKMEHFDNLEKVLAEETEFNKIFANAMKNMSINDEEINNSNKELNNEGIENISEESNQTSAQPQKIETPVSGEKNND